MRDEFIYTDWLIDHYTQLVKGINLSELAHMLSTCFKQIKGEKI